jgi:hypothetical protein
VIDRPFLDPLATLGWKVIDQGQGVIPTDLGARLWSSFRDAEIGRASCRERVLRNV